MKECRAKNDVDWSMMQVQLRALRMEAVQEVLQEEKDSIKRHFAPPSDSGLGTDLPSARMSGGEESYFKG